ncbi:polysaccharide biosynthesis/export family protein [Luteimonas sp. MJ246]|uniref:polysaccharide biosynthesis/export family protein n=1 Tax=Luteimonas sp. MJ174 TaxID=3129237 RepID=UPI0031BB1813
MKQASRFLIAAVFALLLGACASGNRANMGVQLPPPDTTSATGAYEGGTDYRIGTSDLLKITVFGVQELERQARVNSNGQITLPLIGGVMAGGKTIPELEKELAEQYSDGFLQNPQVSVFVEEYTSQRVTVEGSVEKPGIYPLTGRITLLQAIAMAEGLDELADQRGVVLFRQVNGERRAAAFDMSLVRSGEMQDPMVYGDDIIVVEKSGSKTVVREFLNRMSAFAMFLAL